MFLLQGCRPTETPGQNVTAAYYQKVLMEFLIPSIYSMLPNDTITLKQDNAPAHTAKTTKKIFEDKNLKIMFWSGQSPDLNPVENQLYFIAQKLNWRVYNMIMNFVRQPSTYSMKWTAKCPRN